MRLDNMKKPPLKKPYAYIKIALILVFLVACILLIFGAVHYAQRYTVASTAPLKLDAQIIGVKENSSEDSTSYDAIMRYIYNGIVYEAVYDSFPIESDAKALIGRQVTAVVDQDQPGDTLDHLQERSGTLLLLAGIFMLCLVFTVAFPHRQSYVHTYGWHMETVCKDILRLPQYSFSLLLVWAVCFLIVALSYPNVFLAKDVWLANVIMPFLYGIAGIVVLLRWIRDRRLIKDGRVLLRRDTYVRKCIKSDCESGDEYLVTFTNGVDTWKTSVSNAQYIQITEGSTVQTAYLGRRKKPALHYFGDRDVF